ncbi:MAG: prephenate dehydrogenase [Lachnospiraceae bacterium]|nr:prephenate dehydrogenase [Lachnospiraceae bacterium]
MKTNPSFHPSFPAVGFIGLGLIGGSAAKTIKRVYPGTKITAFNRSPEVLDRALAEGVVDKKADETLSAFGECDLIVLCVPVVTALSYMEQLKAIMKPGAILTDVGSVKGDIHRRAKELGLDACFIGGHPMAGSEKTGYESSSDRLLENAYYILTPSEGTDPSRIRALSSFISGIGALPLAMPPEEHDRTVAAVSHLPHIISAALVNLVNETDGPEKFMHAVAAGGFRDITRISSSSPKMWQEICLANSRDICRMVDLYIRMLNDYRERISQKESGPLLQIFSDCKEYRDSFDTVAKGSVPQEYRIYMDLVDEAGSIASIATTLAVKNISIKNIGIVHNREFEQGVLRIVFYEKEAMEEAIRALEWRNYHIYR